MKRKAFICLFICAAVFCFADSEELEMYSWLYNNAQTHGEQLALLQGMSSGNLSGAGEFYGNALARLVAVYGNIRNVSERLYAENQAILLASLVGKEKYEGAASNLWRMYTAFSDPLVKAEALMALGQIRATQYLPQVVKVLDDLNGDGNPPRGDRLSNERVAYGAVISLEKYGEMDGYLPVFFASRGWYTDRVRSQATRSLRVISEDPTDFMIEVIRSARYSYPQKVAALRSIYESDAPDASKSKAALAALNSGWLSTPNNDQERRHLRELRNLSMEVIRAHGCSDAAVYPLLERSYKQYADTTVNSDPTECNNAINTLGTLATEDAARLLSSFLMTLNDKQQNGLVQQKEEGLVRSVIPALGATKQRNARPSLNAVIALGWIENVKNLARNALRELQ